MCERGRKDTKEGYVCVINLGSGSLLLNVVIVKARIEKEGGNLM